MTDVERPPVADWATDFDHTHPDFAARAPEIWDDLRERCPVAHTDRFGGAWLPTRKEDVEAIARDSDHFTSQSVIVNEHRPVVPPPMGVAPPITSDPPFHAIARKLLLPAFSPKAIKGWEPAARQVCRELLDELIEGAEGEVPTVDAALSYTQHIPVRVIAKMLGVPESDGDKFREFIHRILEVPGQSVDTLEPEDTLYAYLEQVIEDHRENPRDDLVGALLEADIEGEPLSGDHIGGTLALLLIAGIDTTWSAIGASLWHLGQVPEHRRHLVENPGAMTFAVEEFLRFYAPVTMARLVSEPVEVGGAEMAPGEWVLLPFPSANRDPEAFDAADEFIIDRQANRHAAFGLGIHRCVGSNLARMELTVALEEWLARIPDFELADPEAVRWSTGQVRGPRTLPMRLLATEGPESAADPGGEATVSA